MRSKAPPGPPGVVRRGGAKGAKRGKAAAAAAQAAEEGLCSEGEIADNLCHVFWMGRYLPRGLGGRDEQLKWMRPRNVSKGS